MRPQPRVQKRVESTRAVVTTVTPEITRHSPRNGFNKLLRALPGDRACLSPSPADNSANLTPASRRQDHTTSPSASQHVRQCATRVHRIPPRVCDDRETPLQRSGTAKGILLIWVRWQAIFLKSRINIWNIPADAQNDAEVGDLRMFCRSAAAPSDHGSRFAHRITTLGTSD
jgi:hypothetical protein